jgi:hypothetical protein
MLFAPKKEVFTLKQFLAGEHKEPQSKTPLQKYTPMMGFMGLPDITHHTFFSLGFSGAYWVVFGVAAFAFLSTLIEYIYRAKGNDRMGDIVETTTKLILPISFYMFLYFGIVKIF